MLASVAASRTGQLLAGGHDRAVALTGGYHVAFIAGATFAALASLVGALFLGGVVNRGPEMEGAREPARSPARDGGPESARSPEPAMADAAC